MKKAVLLVAALVMICSFAFAAEPAAGLKIAEFTGNAKVVLGVDLGTGSIAFANAGEADIKLDLLSAGDKSTTGDNIWGEIKIKADGDPLGLKVQQDTTKNGFDSTKISDGTDDFITSSGYFFPYGFKIFVDVATLHIGSMAYIGIKRDGTAIDYTQLPDTGAAVYYVDPAKYYGQRNTGHSLLGIVTADATVLADSSAGLGPDALYGIVAGISLPNLVNVDVDLRSLNQWSDAPTMGSNQLQTNSDYMNTFGIRAKVDVTAVPNLTAQAGIGTGFGGKDIKYDVAFGGKVAYKQMLTDTIFVQPKVAANAVMDLADEVAVADQTYGKLDGTKDLGFVAQAGVLLGWGAKSKLDFLFSPDKDNDWGYYPGVEAGVQVKSKKYYGGMSKDYSIGLTISAFSGTIVENLSGNAALEINNLMADKDAGERMIMGAMANVKYDIKMDPMTITPKFGLYFLSITPATGDVVVVTDEQKTDVYVKAGVDIAKIFPNTTLSFDYNSNDFVGGVGNIPSAAQSAYQSPLGAITTTLKIAF